MTKTGALKSFWALFGLDAYEENTLPGGENAPAFPYITYQAATDAFDNQLSLTGSIWYRTGSSWAAVNAKAEEISKAIGRSGKYISFDGGALLIQRGSPFALNSPADPNDDAVRRKIINITAEFLSAE